MLGYKFSILIYTNISSQENLQDQKVRDLMSMIARNKDEKNLHLKFIFYHLWRGEIYTVIDYLEKNVQPKNEEKHRELINYLNKHRDEIIDYRRRKKAGKMIGSGLSLIHISEPTRPY